MKFLFIVFISFQFNHLHMSVIWVIPLLDFTLSRFLQLWKVHAFWHFSLGHTSRQHSTLKFFLTFKKMVQCGLLVLLIIQRLKDQSAIVENIVTENEQGLRLGWNRVFPKLLQHQVGISVNHFFPFVIYYSHWYVWLENAT